MGFRIIVLIALNLLLSSFNIIAFLQKRSEMCEDAVMIPVDGYSDGKLRVIDKI